MIFHVLWISIYIYTCTYLNIFEIDVILFKWIIIKFCISIWKDYLALVIEIVTNKKCTHSHAKLFVRPFYTLGPSVPLAQYA